MPQVLTMTPSIPRTALTMTTTRRQSTIAAIQPPNHRTRPNFERRRQTMSTPAIESRTLAIARFTFKSPILALVTLGLFLAHSAGCRHSDQSGKSADLKSEQGKTAGITIIHPEKRDIRMIVIQPGTIEAFETTPVYSRIAGYVQEYRYNIGDRVKQGDTLIDMWIPDLVQTHQQKVATVHRAEVQIDVTQSVLRAAESNLLTAEARIVSARAGVKRA